MPSTVSDVTKVAYQAAQLSQAQLAKLVPVGGLKALNELAALRAKSAAVLEVARQTGKLNPAQLKSLQQLTVRIASTEKTLAALPASAQAALRRSAALIKAEASLASTLAKPGVAKFVQGLDKFGTAVSVLSAGVTGIKAFEDSAFSSTGARAADAAVTGATAYGASAAFGLVDTLAVPLQSVLGVDKQNQINLADTTTQGARGVLALGDALLTGNTSSIEATRARIQADGPVLLRVADDVGQRLADTRLLDRPFAALDSFMGWVSGNDERRQRGNLMLGGG